MKYLTLEYDMNSPVDKAVSVPLDSDYGLAVKAYKGGQPVESAISVDGAASTETRAGWRLFELSSGSEPRQKLVKVQAAEMGTAHYGHTWTEHVENEYDEPDEFKTYFPLSALFEEGTLRLEASKTQLSAWLAGDQSKIDGLYVVQDNDTPDEAYWILSAETGKWVNIWDELVQLDCLDVKSTDFIQAQYILEGRQMAEARAVIEADISEEGEAVGFKLVVKEKDMGRMDVKEQD